jgi:hypothetical protein
MESSFTGREANRPAHNFLRELERDEFFGEVTLKFKNGVAYLFEKRQTLQPDSFAAPRGANAA